MIKNIWTNTEDIIDARLKEMYPEIFDDGDVKEFYIPGNKPNEISLKKWEKLVKENPLLDNTDLPFAVSKQGEIVCIEKIKTAIKIGLVGETQTGKCLWKNTNLLIKTKKGYDIKPIKELYNLNEHIQIYSLNKDYKVELRNITNIENQGKKQLFEVELKNGIKGTFTENHKMLVLGEQGQSAYKELKDIKEGEFLPNLINLPLDNNRINYCFEEYNFQLTHDFGFLCGVYIAEGNIDSQIKISVQDELLKYELKRISSILSIPFRETNNLIALKKSIIPIRKFLKEEFKTGSANKDIPNWVFSTNNDFKRGLLSGYFSGDGEMSLSKPTPTSTVKRLNFGYTSKSEKLADKLKLLFNSFGILCRKSYKQINSGSYKGNVYTSVRIEQTYLDIFMKKIGFIHSDKNKAYEEFKKIKRNYNQKLDKIPSKKEAISKIIKSYKLRTRGTKTRDMMCYFKRKANQNKGCGRQHFKKLFSLIKTNEIESEEYINYQNLINGDVYWSPIISIKKVKDDDCYDLSIEGNENFMLANGLFVHNSTALYSMADIMRWWWRFKIGFMNEGLSICYDHLHKNRVPVFAKKHKMLGMQPMGLPLVFCYPSVEDLELPGVKPELRISVPFKEFLKDPRLFCDLGKSSKHLAKLKPELKGLESFEEIDVKIEESDMPGNSKKALSSAINELSEAKLFDLNNNPHSNLIVKRMEKLTVKEDYDLNPLVALMKADLIPCLMTSKLAGNKYEEKVFNFYLKAIWHSKEKGGPLRDSPIALFIDELNQVQGNNREILIKMVREGANMGAGGISMMWCAQNYLLIDQVIRNNTTIGFIFRQTGEDATAIGKRYCLNKYWVDRIPQLQKFECLLVTKDRFKLYNPSTGKVYYSEEPILAEILPPLSLHRKELSLDDYATPIKPHYLHERVLKANRHFIFDTDGKGLFTKRTFSAFANGSAINESVELTRKRLNVHPITIYEEDDLKSEYFKGNLQKNEDISYQDLQRMGLRIISMPSKMIIGEDTQIRVMYAFWPITLPIPEDAMILQSCPHVTIIFNNDKNAVRMYSTNCGSFKTKKLTGTSDWFYLEKLKKL